MYRNILVPLDSSTFGEHALPLAMSLARRSGAALKLLHVHTPLATVYLEGAAFLDNTLETDIKAQMQVYLDGVLGRVRVAQPMLSVSTQLAEGDVASLIGSAAATGGSDLVVMTTHGRGPIGRFWLGSVADAVVRHLPMPLLLVRPTSKPPALNQEPTIKHILIPLDGTDLSEKIIPAAVALGKLMDAEYTLVRMIKPVLPYDSPAEVMTVTAAVKAVLDRVEELQEQVRREAAQYLEKVAAALRKQGLKVNIKVDIDVSPAHAILQDVEENHLDMIALETHGRGGLARMLLGSVTDKVIRGTHVPVLVHKGA